MNLHISGLVQTLISVAIRFDKKRAILKLELNDLTNERALPFSSKYERLNGRKRVLSMSYIQHMRSLIGTERLFTVGCGIVIEDEHERILLQRRSDSDIWGIPGGIMEIGESFSDSATREVYEETGLIVHDPDLFGLYSGEDCYVTYPNGDQMYSVQIIFYSNDYEGILSQNDEESKDHQFFNRSSLPHNLNPRQKSFIMDWAEKKARPILR